MKEYAIRFVGCIALIFGFGDAQDLMTVNNENTNDPPGLITYSRTIALIAAGMVILFTKTKFPDKKNKKNLDE